MRAKIFFITLAVDDLARSVSFYRDGLGWPTDGVVGQKDHRVAPSQAPDRVIHIDPELHAFLGGETGPRRPQLDRRQRAIFLEAAQDRAGGATRDR